MRLLSRIHLHKGFSILLMMGISAGCTTTTLPTRKPVIPPQQLSYAEKKYKKIEEVLPLYQNALAHPWVTIDPDTRFRVGKENPAVVLLRARLNATEELSEPLNLESNIYDHNLSISIKHFQKNHGLNPDGIIGKETIDQLNISPEVRLHQLQINLQRWQQLTAKLKDHFILVNIPDYQLEVIEDDKAVLMMKVIVGKSDRETPEIYSTINRMVLNPYWNVPKSIAEKDIIPKILNNPDYLTDMNIKIINREEDTPVEINPDDIDWSTVETEGFPYHFRQDPGIGNSLGLIKFEFPNTQDIYLHDTPAKNLFTLSKRALSSGCIRLEKPFELALYLMNNQPDFNLDRLNNYVDIGKTKYIPVLKPTAIFITYMTAWVDEQGEIEFREDIYTRDSLPPKNTMDKNNSDMS